MSEALLWGVVASSSLFLGGLVALRWNIPDRLLGLVMAFGAGVLISAVAFELIEEAIDTAVGAAPVGTGLLAGSAVYFLGDKWLERRQGDKLKGRTSRLLRPSEHAGSPLALVLGIVLDGIPESFVLGLTVLTMGEVSVAFLAAVFLSNMPESIAASAGLRENGWSNGRILGLWLLVMIVSGLAAVAGYVLLDQSGDRVVAFVMAFAAGAILTMLADAMMPEAFEKTRLLAGPATTFGFAVAVLLSSIQ